MHSIRNGLALGALAIVLFATTQASAANYYVRTSGDDTNVGTSASTAFATISRAAADATNGDTVYVGGGIYSDAAYVLGKKASSSLLRFVADVTGAQTGDSGAVVISGAPFHVAGCNYVEIENFTFQGGAAYPLIWRNSYNGVVRDCTFVGGTQALLVKDGKLTLDDCQLSSFQGDAVHVDGEARLTLQDCDISDTFQHAILVHKDAAITINNSDIDGSSGDGVHVEALSSSVSLGNVPPPHCDCHGTSPQSQQQQARDLLATLAPADPVYQAILTSAMGKLDSAVSSANWTDGWHVDIGSASNVFDNLSDAVEEVHAVLNEDVDFIIQNGEIVVSHPFVAEVDVIGAAIVSGGSNMPVTVRINVGNTVYQPWGSFTDADNGDVNDNNNPRNFQSPDTFDETDAISVDATSWYGDPGDWDEYLTVNSASGSQQVDVLRNGDDVPTYNGYNGQASAEQFLQPYISADDKIVLEDNQVIFLFELGTTNMSSNAADFQDLVVVVTMQRSITPLTQAEKDTLQQVLDTLMESLQNLVECAIDEATVGGGDASDLATADADHQAAIASAAADSYVAAAADWQSAWLAAKSSTGNIEPDLDAVVATLIQAAPPADWQAVTAGSVTAQNSTFSDNENGIMLESPVTFDASSSDFTGNEFWGLSLQGSFSLDGCSIEDNQYGGVRLTGMTDSDATINDLDVADNAQYGLFLSNCTMTVDQTTLDDWGISGSDYVVAGQSGSLTLDGVTVTGGPVAGVYFHQGTLTVQNSMFSGNGYGIAADESVLIIDNSTVTQNSTGLYTNNNGSVDITGSSIHDNAVTGADFNSPTAKVTLTNSQVYSNVNGISLVGASNGDFELIQTVVRDNSQHGLHFDGCTLSFADQATNGWQSLRNGCGITCENSTLTLTNVQLEDSGSYGLYGIGSTVVMENCNVTAANGIYLAADNVNFTANATAFTATGVSGAWGLSQLGGTMTVKNCLINGFENGLYLNGGTSNVYNATLTAASNHGVYVSGAVATVKNTIVSGFSGQQGMTLTTGVLDHSYNLLHGFATPFTGTSAHSSEILKKPQFVDAFSNDYHLAVGSPAINSGTDLSAEFTADRDGNARPSHGAFEIGAYEYLNSQGSFRVLDWQEAQ